MDAALDLLGSLLKENSWVAPFIALIAGFLTSLTPCSLSSVPLIIGYVGGRGEGDAKAAFRLSLTFAAGAALAFTALGTAAALAGRLLNAAGSWWYILLGVLMLLMALQTFGVYEFIPSTYLVSKSARKGYFGAFAAGILGGLFSSPCSTPVLVVLLGLVARSGNVAWGVFLLLVYSVGAGALSVAAGTSVGLVKRITGSGKYGAFSAALRYVTGGAMLLIGLYLLYLGF